MSNIIAVIWDCDRTLIDGYMQDPIFEYYGISSKDFWKTDREEIEKSRRNGIRVNNETFYLNSFIRAAHNGMFKDLSNAKLREFGKMQKFYPGIPEILKKTKEMFKDDKSYSEHGIQVEHYIVSTGFAEVIRGSVLMDYVEEIWGCELLEDEAGLINEIVYTIDNTTKTRAVFEINKGKDVQVNSRIPEELRRVRFENMIYIADGPSDIPAFSVVKKGGGATFAIYPKGDLNAMRQVEQMRADGRVDMYAEANYSEGTTAYMWITDKIQQMADNIRSSEQKKVISSASSVPHHLT